MPQEKPGQSQESQQPPEPQQSQKSARPVAQIPQDQQIKLAQKIIQSKLPQPVQIGAKKKIPNWLPVLVGVLAVLAISVGVTLVAGKISSPGPQKSKSTTKTATSGAKQGAKNTCKIYTRKGAASKTKSAAKEGDREITVKFKEGSEVRASSNKFVSLCGEDLSQINNLLSIYSNLSIARSFSSKSEEELAAEFKAAKENYPAVADLNLFYRITLPEGTPTTAVDYLVNKLNEFSVVEVAYPESQPSPLP
jgi:hypothetical protein